MVHPKALAGLPESAINMGIAGMAGSGRYRNTTRGNLSQRSIASINRMFITTMLRLGIRCREW
jgi:hypothetical protein